MASVLASAPAKIIVFGEHSVVYGQPAVAAAINLRAYAEASFNDRPTNLIYSENLKLSYEWELSEKNSMDRAPKRLLPLVFAVTNLQSLLGVNQGVKLHLKSEIPIGSGLGSSAAVSVASIAALSKLYSMNLELERISTLSYQAEKITHGTPSGIDNTISTYGSILKFQKGNIISRNLDVELPIVVGNSLVSRSTREVVEDVRQRQERYLDIFDPIMESMGVLAEKGFEYLAAGNLDAIAELMMINQGLLEALGVGHPVLRRMCDLVIEHGALGAKLTGAGRGGSIIALCDTKQCAKNVQEALIRDGFPAFQTTISSTGVRYEDHVLT